MDTHEHLSQITHLTIQALPDAIRAIFVRSGHQPLPETARPWGLFVRYLRRKPERGLAIIYDACEICSWKQRACAVHQTVSLTLAESALAGSTICITPAQIYQADLINQPMGIVQAIAY
ncbi:MAG: hypothetical protein ACRDHZ_25165, partial [Ktedonobacteraceae bacterium]